MLNSSIQKLWSKEKEKNTAAWPSIQGPPAMTP